MWVHEMEVYYYYTGIRQGLKIASFLHFLQILFLDLRLERSEML